MRIKQKIFISIVLIAALSFIGAKTQAISLDDIKSQITIILAQIAELQRQLDALRQTEYMAADQPKSLVVASPAGSEKWETGNSYDIKWDSTGYSSNATAKIQLLDARYPDDPSKNTMNIVTTGNSGTYSWQVPQLLNNNELLGSLYKISVSLEENGNKLSAETPGYFTLTDEGFAYSPYFNIIAPKEGTILQGGQTFRILWDYPNPRNYKIKITLKKDLIGNYREIASDISDRSYYDWTVPKDLAGVGYGITINAYDNEGNPTFYKSTNTTITITQLWSVNIKNQLAAISSAISSILENIKGLIK